MVKNKKNQSTEEKSPVKPRKASLKSASNPDSFKALKTPVLEFDLSDIKTSKSASNPEFSLSDSKPKKKPKQPPEDEPEGTDKIFKPGQKHPEPGLDDPLRAFYESLYEQNPSSLMAQKYCLENGLLSEETSRKLLKLRSKKSK